MSVFLGTYYVRQDGSYRSTTNPSRENIRPFARLDRVRNSSPDSHGKSMGRPALSLRVDADLQVGTGAKMSGDLTYQKLPVWKGGIFPHLAKVELPVVRDNTQKGRIAYETPTRTAAANETLSFRSGRIRYRGGIAGAGGGPSLTSSLAKSGFSGNSALSSLSWTRATSVFFSRRAASASKIFANGCR